MTMTYFPSHKIGYNGNNNTDSNIASKINDNANMVNKNNAKDTASHQKNIFYYVKPVFGVQLI